MNNKLLPTILGFGVSLLGIYIIVRVSSSAWASGKKIDKMKLLFGFGTNKYAKGGIISFYDKDNEHLLGSASRYIDKDVLKKIVFKEIIEYKNYIGNFGWKESKHEGYLYKLDENDQDLVKDVKKKEGEIIFRYVTYATAIGGMTPLIKINLDNGMLYFLENWGDDKIVFSTKGVKAIYINIIEYKLKN